MAEDERTDGTADDQGSASPERPPLPHLVAETGLVVVLRTTQTEHLLAVADTLVEAGARCLEVTFTVPSAADWVARLRERFGDAATVGAGTVLTTGELRSAIDAGAEFAISPSFDPDIVRGAREAGVPCVPGTFTPTEVWDAWTAGASAVKLFPAGVLGPAALSALRGPFPDVPLIPTGGIEIDDAGAWIRAGAVAVGLGGPLLGTSLVDGDVRTLSDRTSRLLAEIASTRT